MPGHTHAVVARDTLSALNVHKCPLLASGMTLVTVAGRVASQTDCTRHTDLSRPHEAHATVLARGGGHFPVTSVNETTPHQRRREVDTNLTDHLLASCATQSVMRAWPGPLLQHRLRFALRNPSVINRGRWPRPAGDAGRWGSDSDIKDSFGLTHPVRSTGTYTVMPVYSGQKCPVKLREFHLGSPDFAA